MKMEKRLIAVVLAVILVFTNLTPVAAKSSKTTKAPKLTVTKNIRLEAGSTKKLEVKGKQITKATYKTSNKSIATVSDKGVVKGLKQGKCKVTVTVNYYVYKIHPKSKKPTKQKVKQNKKYVCQIVVNPKKTKPQNNTNKFEAGVADFSVQLFKSFSQQVAEGENVFLSPESAFGALALCANGADGDTRTEFETVLCNGMTMDAINENYHARNQKLRDSQDVKFQWANGIWMKDVVNGQQVVIKDEFLANADKYYEANAKSVPFDATTVKEINSWVEEKTNGMIPQLIDQFGADTMSCIVNAIAFEGKWAQQYSEEQVIKEQTFTNAWGEKETATMLKSEESAYISDSKVKGFVKYYEGGEYAFMALLPKKAGDLVSYIESLDGQKLRNLYQSRQCTAKVITKMPEFACDYDTNLNDALLNMGIREAFDENAADFTKMAELKGANVFISDVIQKAHIEVDRYGTKAAAATAVLEKVTSARPGQKIEQVYLDRPFLYAVIDMSTGLPLFMGVVNSVDKS